MLRCKRIRNLEGQCLEEHVTPMMPAETDWLLQRAMLSEPEHKQSHDTSKEQHSKTCRIPRIGRKSYHEGTTEHQCRARRCGAHHSMDQCNCSGRNGCCDCSVRVGNPLTLHNLQQDPRTTSTTCTCGSSTKRCSTQTMTAQWPLLSKPVVINN